MRKWMLVATLLLGAIFQADATTYDYTGQPFTQFGGLCNASNCTSVTGSVTFNFDTSHFSGTLFLTAGDTASLSEGIPWSLSGSALYFQPVALFPSSTIWFNPPANIYGFTQQLIGNLTLVDGTITSWALDGGTGQVGCGGGPGCAIGSSSVYTGPTSDSSDMVSYNGYNDYLIDTNASNSGGGIWVEDGVAAVPEPSTWAMLLIGFAAMGFVAYRRKSKPALMAA
jgi:hypothetical protein